MVGAEDMSRSQYFKDGETLLYTNTSKTQIKTTSLTRLYKSQD